MVVVVVVVVVVVMLRICSKASNIHDDDGDEDIICIQSYFVMSELVVLRFPFCCSKRDVVGIYFTHFTRFCQTAGVQSY